MLSRLGRWVSFSNWLTLIVSIFDFNFGLPFLDYPGIHPRASSSVISKPLVLLHFVCVCLSRVCSLHECAHSIWAFLLKAALSREESAILLITTSEWGWGIAHFRHIYTPVKAAHFILTQETHKRWTKNWAVMQERPRHYSRTRHSERPFEITISTTDMPLKMQDFIMERVMECLYHRWHPKKMCRYIREKCNEKYGPSWDCFVSREYYGWAGFSNTQLVV